MNLFWIVRIVSLLIGYGFGCILTAEWIAKRWTGHGAGELGDTGNPGMANIMASLGFVPGILTLAGDLGKCILAAVLTSVLFHGSGRILILYAGLGCTLGHDFPVWRRFRGGKGVATTSMAVVLYAFFPGLAANIAGMLTVFVSKYLCIGGPVIPAVFLVLMAVKGDAEAAYLAGVLTLLAVRAHWSSICGIPAGQTKKTDVPAANRKKLRK